MGKNLSGSTLEKQKSDLVLKTMFLGNKKSKLTEGMIHSCSRLTSKNNTLDQFVDFLKAENFHAKLNLVTADYLSAFLESKVYDENCNKTIQEHLSKISSSWTALEKLGYETKIYNSEFSGIREEFKNAGHATFHRDRAFKSPKEVINNLYKMRLSSGIIAELQYTCGYRIHEAFQVSPDTIEFEGDNLFVKEGVIKGKGGFPLHKKAISAELGKKIGMQYLFLNKWEINASTFNNDIKAVTSAQYSSHSFRYNYAQHLYMELLYLGWSETNARFKVSEEMGHHRAEIVGCYVG